MKPKIIVIGTCRVHHPINELSEHIMFDVYESIEGVE